MYHDNVEFRDIASDFLRLCDSFSLQDLVVFLNFIFHEDRLRASTLASSDVVDCLERTVNNLKELRRLVQK
jgi:hypothetical protein